MNGDVLTDMNYAELLASHVASGAAATIATHTRAVQISLGVLKFDDADRPDPAHRLRREAHAALPGLHGRLLLLAEGP